MWSELRSHVIRVPLAKSTILGLVVIFVPGSILAETVESRRVVMFTAEPIKSNAQQQNIVFDRSNIRMRELVRQAVLLAAREECGLATRDESLGEPVFRGDQDCIVVNVALNTETSLILRLSRSGREFYSRSIDLNFDTKIQIVRPVAYVSLVEQMEKLSRTEIAAALEKEGYPRRRTASGKRAELTQEISDQLGQMNPISQYSALRQLHRMNSTSADSSVVLGGLVRSYSHMSQLMLPVLDLRFKAYAARALLYAQRFVQLHQDSAEPYWHRAYAWTWIGYPNAGRDDLEKAATLAGPGDAFPAWVTLLQSYHYFRFEELKAAAYNMDSSEQETAALMWFLASRMVHSNPFRLETGRQALKIAPHCQRIVAGMCEVAGISSGHQLTSLGPELQASVIRQYLSEVQDLPETAKFSFQAETEVDSLRQPVQEVANEAANDIEEPSWYVLSSNIQAWNAEVLFRRAYFLRYQLGVEAQDYIASMRPVLEDDQYLPLFDALGEPRLNSALASARVFADVTPPELNFNSVGYEVLQALQSHATNGSSQDATRLYNWMIASWADSSMLEDEYIKRLRLLSGVDRLDSAKWLAQASKAAPAHFADRIFLDWKNLGDKKEWFGQEYAHYPDVQLALGVAYVECRKYDQAIEAMQRYLAMVPDADGYIQLAQVYYLSGDDSQWLEALENSFECEDYGLSHAMAAQHAASTLMHAGHFEEARPWAERSAESYSSWGVDRLIECLTALGEMKEAESLAKQMSDRYQSNAWYQWCAETGEGDLKAAWSALQRQLKQQFPEGHPQLVFSHLWHALVENDLPRAHSRLRERFSKQFSSNGGVLLALLADRAGDTAHRDEVLARLAEHPKDDPAWSPLCDLAEVFQQAIRSGSLDLDEMAVRLDRAGKDKAELEPLFRLYSGFFLSSRNQQEEAIQQWKIAARSSSATWYRAVAWIWLRQAGVDPIHLEGRKFSGMFERSPTRDTQEEQRK